MTNTNILGVNIHKIKQIDLLSKIKDGLNSGKKIFITTPNPEILLKTDKDEELFYILNNADYSVPDGFGIILAGLCNFIKLHRTPGSNLTKSLIKICETSSTKVLIVNWEEGLSSLKDIEQSLIKEYPRLDFLILNSRRDGSNFNIFSAINFNPKMLFCNFGSPFQEKFVYHTLNKIKSLKSGIGVGGSFDFITKNAKRAPRLLSILGLEWLWRMAQNPKKRYKRIINAAIIFPTKFLKWRFINPFFYRRNVACMLYKKENEVFKILLLERTDSPGHWQLPQGGLDGESIKSAGKRELKEETNTTKFKTVYFSKNFLYKYTFDYNSKKFKIKTQKQGGYKGQKQGIYIAEFYGKSEDISLNFWEFTNWQWVDLDKIENIIHPIRKKSATKFIKIFKNNITK